MRPWIAAVAALALVTAACGDDDAGSAAAAPVLPFADIQDSDLVFEMDPADPGRALFHVTTSIPTICSIVWGETPNFGRQNNSLTMNGTGIEQHDVVLPGAEAGAEYHFVILGGDADGNLYASDVMTVTIPETGSAVFAEGSTGFERSDEGGPARDGGGPSAATGENLALGATISDVSSEFGDGFTADLAIDGDPATEWSSAGDGDAGFIEVDLGSPREVAGFEFVTRSMADGSAITERFEVTVDGGPTFGPFPAGTPRDGRYAALDASITGRVFRFAVTTTTGGNTGAVEVRILAPA